MSLTAMEKRATKRELQENFELSGLSVAQAAADLQTTPTYLQRVLDLNVRHIEDPWIVRNYLNQVLRQQHQTPIAYSRLIGSPAEYWFLNEARVTRGQLN
ncbi:DUF2316 family protein [Levilactobacillus parabrevis]|uniref:DUF2316 family protein n=1 Tax=Levilactobacillus parabrevis TaxID=357278 RepID=UPI0021A92049|nr:DUF2316 family protein [Levilactobacillus parabrevis]MCT4488321.1 DUF2316 family protein [Levilactobacillus parabrevis]MCT4490292.1 DUF2316 family protein [Levilactobacillus parabrevis]